MKATQVNDEVVTIVRNVVMLATSRQVDDEALLSLGADVWSAENNLSAQDLLDLVLSSSSRQEEESLSVPKMKPKLKPKPKLELKPKPKKEPSHLDLSEFLDSPDDDAKNDNKNNNVNKNSVVSPPKDLPGNISSSTPKRDESKLSRMETPDEPDYQPPKPPQESDEYVEKKKIVSSSASSERHQISLREVVRRIVYLEAFSKPNRRKIRQSGHNNNNKSDDVDEGNLAVAQEEKKQPGNHPISSLQAASCAHEDDLWHIYSLPPEWTPSILSSTLECWKCLSLLSCWFLVVAWLKRLSPKLFPLDTKEAILKLMQASFENKDDNDTNTIDATGPSGGAASGGQGEADTNANNSAKHAELAERDRRRNQNQPTSTQIWNVILSTVPQEHVATLKYLKRQVRSLEDLGLPVDVVARLLQPVIFEPSNANNDGKKEGRRSFYRLDAGRGVKCYEGPGLMFRESEDLQVGELVIGEKQLGGWVKHQKGWSVKDQSMHRCEDPLKATQIRALSLVLSHHANSSNVDRDESESKLF
mmetsp:Transcript_26042/g.46258  ORF Transcript_26042/g.46258 Transcript_26042/m.46258 type:complete len:531 (-) Transcript_26042:79-1671(-)